MNKGFTLLEILLTMVILVIGIMALLEAMNTVLFADGQTQHNLIAVQLAQEKMEEIKSVGSYAAIDGFIQARANLGGHFADFDREVGVSGDPKTVEVSVYWGPASQEQRLQLVTLMADYNY